MAPFFNTGCTYIETIHTRQTTETFFALFSISTLKLFLTLTMSGVCYHKDYYIYYNNLYSTFYFIYR